MVFMLAVYNYTKGACAMIEKKVTIKEVAAEAGVSIATVSYVINKVDRVAEETRIKVTKAIEKLKYQPNILARSLVKNENRIIGVLTNIDLQSAIHGDPFFQEFVSGLEFRLKELDYSNLMITIDNTEKSLEYIKNYALSGIILLGHFNNSVLQFLDSLSIPILAVDQKKTNNNFIYLNTDDNQGALLAVEYLIQNDHKNIGFLGVRIGAGHIHATRLEGYKLALKKNNIAFDEDYIFETKITYEGGTEAADQIARKMDQITAVFCTADIIALGLIKGLYKKGIHVPNDFSVIGFDNIKHGKYFIPELTTISQNISLKSTKAADLIIDAINGSNNFEYVMPIELIERESVKKLYVP